jgi:PTH1 family peptidyl-tRNA hydrolase
MKFIIGLGNPGLLYKNTRHNIGFLALDFLVKNYLAKKSKWQNNRAVKAEILETDFADQKIILVKPQTYMNESGQTINALQRKYSQFNTKDLIIIHDDLDLPLGKLRIKSSGSAGGHNGIKSIIQHLNNSEFIRIKIGINQTLQSKIPAEKFVLQRFNRDQKAILNQTFSQLPDLISDLLIQDITTIMNRYN